MDKAVDSEAVAAALGEVLDPADLEAPEEVAMTVMGRVSAPEVDIQVVSEEEEADLEDIVDSAAPADTEGHLRGVVIAIKALVVTLAVLVAAVDVLVILVLLTLDKLV